MAKLLGTLRGPRQLKHTSRREITYFIPMAEEDDGRPDSSPFESPSTEVYFSDDAKFIVPSSLFLHSPRLRSGGKWPPRTVSLDDVTSAVGHVIFYYLLTETYQCLKPKGSSHHERLVSELTTSVGAYNASRKYELSALQEISKDEIQRLARQLPFPLVLNLLRDLHLDPNASEMWLDDYVQSGLKNLFRTPTAFLDYTTPQVEQDVISFSNIILKNLANLLANDAAPVPTNYAETPTRSPEPVVIEEALSPVDSEPISEVEPLPEPTEPAPSEYAEYAQEASPMSKAVAEAAEEAEPAVGAWPFRGPEPESALEVVHEDVHEVTREVAPEAEILEKAPVPEVTPEPKTAYGAWDWGESSKALNDKPTPDETTAVKAAPVSEVIPEPKTAYGAWGWGVSSKALNDKPTPDEPTVVEAIPEPEALEASIQYTPPRAEYLERELEPVSERAQEEWSFTAASSKPAKKKKRLSLFRTEDNTLDDESEVQTPPQTEPAVIADDMLSPASSSGLAAMRKSKKKKKKGIFRTEEVPEPAAS